MAPSPPSVVFQVEDQAQQEKVHPSEKGHLVSVDGSIQKGPVGETVVELKKSTNIEGLDTSGSERTHSSDEEASSQADEGEKWHGSDSSILSVEDAAQRKRSSLDFWTKRMADSPRCLFPTITDEANDSGAFESHLVDVDFAQLYAFCETQRVDFMVALQVVWIIVLQGYTIADEVLFGFLTVGGHTPWNARNVSRARPTFGICHRHNQQHIGVCRDKRRESDTFANLAQRLQQDLDQTLQHQHLEAAEAESIISPSRKLFNTVISLVNEEDLESPNDPPSTRNHVGRDIHRHDVTLEVNLTGSMPSMRIIYSTALLGQADSASLARSLTKIAAKLCREPDTLISSFHIVSEEDIDLDTYNNLPEPTASCAHWLINDQIRQRPDDEAVASWDGSLTYRELGQHTSRLATKLQGIGIGPGVYVAFCFPKSLWATITIVALQMTGAAFVPVDPKAPPARWRSILDTVNGTIAVCSPEYAQRFQGVVDTICPVDAQYVEDEPSDTCEPPTSAVAPQDPSFLVFTSGSTGKPKGIVMEHQTVCSLSNGHAKHLKIGPGVRVFQFSAYTFDAGIMDVLATLIRGGCVCVPSEHDRLNNLSGVMTQLRASWVFMTPTVAELLSPQDVPYLKVMAVGGETISPQLALRWRDVLDLHGVYGPTEVSICASNDELGYAKRQTCLGKPVSSAFWIVDPDRTTRLMPDGCVGEMIIQGPLLARGYISADEKAMKNWIIDASRLPAGIPAVKSYLTGDLVKKHRDGTYEFIGRKDSQVKINGQRTELGEIETRLSAALPYDLRGMIDIIPGEDRSLNILTALLWYTEGPYLEQPTCEIIENVTEEHRTILADVDKALRSLLPPYMIPSVYLIFQGVPEQTHSGKVDRRQLLSMAQTTTPTERRLFAPDVAKQQAPSSPMELRLRDMWAGVLRIAPGEISRNDNFFRLGGDSILAIKLVGEAQQCGVDISVASIFENPQLSDMALAPNAIILDSDVNIEPFSLLPEGLNQEEALDLVRSQCRLTPAEDIEDLYPCSALQQGLMAIAAKKPGSYIARNVYKLQDTTEVDLFKTSWEQVLLSCPILRTRFAFMENGMTLQAVIKGRMGWECLQTTDLRTTLSSWKDIDMGYGSRLCRYALIQDGGSWYFIWAIHHALYDGWAMRMILESLEQTYHGAVAVPLQPFPSFIKYLTAADQNAAADYWTRQLSGAKGGVFPTPTYKTPERTSSNNFRTTIPFAQTTQSLVTKATVLRAAWAIVLARYCDSDDICFGVTVSGRHAPIARANDVAGPMIATVPVRVQINQSSSVIEYLQRVQDQSSGMIKFEQFGLQNITKLGPDAEAACNFSSLLVIQPSDIMDIAGEDSGKILVTGSDEKALTEEASSDYFDYPLVLQAVIHHDTVDLIFVYDANVVSPSQCLAVSQQLSHVTQQLLSNGDQPLSSISVSGPWDLKQAIEWNGPEVPIINETLHSLIQSRISQHPHTDAVYCTGGSHTYAQLDRQSRLLAKHLRRSGATPGSIVPICFEPSPWVVVAMLAILRAGYAFMPLDPAHPEERKAQLIKEVGAKLLVASSKTAEPCRKIARDVVELCESFFELAFESQVEMDGLSETLATDAAAYVLFTSGSTGKPKGVVVEHSAICTSILSYGKKHKVQRSSRMIQFSSYAFDASVYEIFLTLVFGGTVCIPSEAERLGNLTDFMNSARVTTGFLTPSFVKTLDAERLPTMKSLVLIGEAPTLDVIENWRSKVQLINGYGPTECSACCASHVYDPEATLLSAKTIGQKVHGPCWVVEPENHNCLTPIGCVGELLIQGPALARGYYNDDAKTSAAFIDTVDWFPVSAVTKSSRFYKTGDLVRYNFDGTLDYRGRKDTQVKLRGQRLELSEIEYALQLSSSHIQNVAAILINRLSTSFLVAFIEFKDQSCESGANGDKSSENVLSLEGNMVEILSELSGKVRSILPSYMVPSFFVPLRGIPFVTSMKMDRRGLQDLADQFSTEDLSQYSLQSAEKVEPVTHAEIAMRRLWAQTLGVSAEDIGRHDSFLHIGGDSITAIQLSALARKVRLDLPVSEIFKDARLSAVAIAAVPITEEDEPDDAAPEPFSLLQTSDISDTVQSLCTHCKLGQSEVIQDAYPCTPLQEGLLALGVKHPGSYIAKHVYRIAPEVDIDRFKAAWEHVYNMCDNQRLRIVKLGSDSIQVLVGGDFEWEPTGKLSLREFLEVAQNMNMSYGSKLCRSAIIEDGPGERYLVWVIHHATFDGWTMTLILSALRDAYYGVDIAPFNPYSKFIKYSSGLDMERAGEYWKDQLRDAQPASFPPLPSKTNSAFNSNEKVTRLISRTVEFPPLTRSSITKGTILRAAWALVLARYGNADDVCFGSTASGRNARVPGIERMAGTVIGTVPVRIRIDSKKPMLQFLQDIQNQALDMVPYEQTGFQNIAKISPEAQHACEVSSLLIVQPEKQMDIMANAASSLINRAADDEYPVTDTMEGYFTFPIVIQCPIFNDHVVVHFTYDSSVVSTEQMDALCRHYEVVVQQLLAQDERLVGEISLSSSWDLQQAIQYNTHVQDTVVHECIHDLMSKWAKEMPDHEALYSTEMTLTYGQLDKLSSWLSSHLSTLGVTLETVVPICFDKSIWTVVAMLGIMKAGGVFMPMDPSHPYSRRQALINQVGARHLVVSPSVAPSCEGLVQTLVQVSPGLFSDLGSMSNAKGMSIKSHVSPTNAAYILFTSGSTGQPKGIVVEHTAIASSIASHGQEFKLNTSSRVLQFASYVFDVSVSEILTTLVFGGTVCIPTQTERMQEVADFINRSRVDTAMLTPSFVTTFSPDQVPSLKTLILGGEAPTKETLAMWQPRVRLLNGYAPAECCIYAITHTYSSVGENPTILGKGLHTNCWIVEPDDHHKLAPIGCVGELVIHGNTIGRGYVNDKDRTAAAFIDSVKWMPSSLQKTHYRFYKSGDLVQYDANGEIEYLGRKDTQVKLRGQRIELGEIEYNIRSILQDIKHVAVEVVRRNSREALIVFVSFATTDNDMDHQQPADRNNLFIHMSEPMKLCFENLVSELGAKLPPYMVPSLFMPLRRMPFLSSLKVDRRRLRSLVDGLSAEEYARLSLSRRSQEAPTTEMEIKIRDMWAQTLAIRPDQISKDDSFFQVGGDSVAAMQLSTLAQKGGIHISIAKMFEDSTLASMAEDAMASGRLREDWQIEPFGLLPAEHISNIVADALIQCDLSSPDDIEDIYPCTPLQQGMVALSIRQSGAYTSTSIYRLTPETDISRFKLAWDKTVLACSNLRTRFVIPTAYGNGLPLQVVTSRGSDWQNATGHDVSSFEKEMGGTDMALGSPLCRYALVEHDQPVFVLTMHHAIYDLWAMHLIMETLEAAYESSSLPSLDTYATFVNYTIEANSTLTRNYWLAQLDGVKQIAFPRSPIRKDGQMSMKSRESTITFPSSSGTSITKATILRAAWAIVLARYCETNDVCFGTTVSGRLAPLSGLSNMAGPTIATVPVRLCVHRDQTVSKFLSHVQSHSSEMIAHEQYGLQNIAKLGPEAREACDFSTLLVIQPVQQVAAMRPGRRVLLEELKDAQAASLLDSDLQNYFDYPLVVNCVVSDDSIGLHVYYDSNTLLEIELDALEHHMSRVVQQLLLQDDAPLSSVSLVDEWDTELALASQPNLQRSSRCTYQVFRRHVEQSPNGTAIDSWDGMVSYQELESLSSSLSKVLRNAGVSPGSIVPICLPPSKWAVAAMMATQLVGAAFVFCDFTGLEDYLSSTSRRGKERIALIPEYLDVSSLSADITLVAVGQTSLASPKPLDSLETPDVHGEDASFISYTAGTTGPPKAVIHQHESICSAAEAFGSIAEITSSTRVLQFSPYITHIGVMETFAALLNGGCICIAQSSQVCQSINATRANLAVLTPSTADSISPSDVPMLRCLALVGEPITKRSTDRWAEKVNLYCIYSSAETPICAWTDGSCSTEGAINIGRPISSAFWVVEETDYSRLAPVGCVGELLIEGSHVAKGYSSGNAAEPAFIDDLVSLPGDQVHRLFKTGDLVRRNFDGSFDYIGRKVSRATYGDSQTGLEVVEMKMKALLPENMDGLLVVLDSQGDGSQALVGLIWSVMDTKPFETSLTPLLHVSEDLDRMVSSLSSSLALTVPQYTMPSAFIFFKGTPARLPSGKINRREVISLAKALPADMRRHVATSLNKKELPTTETEFKLRDLWSTVLGISTSDIGKNDNFLQLGGDSISAIQLVALGRQKGLVLNVSSIFKDPRLCEMALSAVLTHTQSSLTVEPFALLSQAPSDYTLHEIRQQCSLRKTDTVEDMYPCTPLQEGLLALGVKQPRSYIARHVFKIGTSVDLSLFRYAWARTVEISANLRTRILLMDGRSVQAVIKGDMEWEDTSGLSIESYMDDSSRFTMGYGSSLSRYALLSNNTFVWTIHHAICDGWTMQIIMDRFLKAYHRLQTPEIGSFAHFIKHTTTIDASAATKYWDAELSGATRAAFPAGTTAKTDCVATFSKFTRLARPAELPVTLATVLRAAWAVTIAKYCDINDVTFGMTVSGRQAAIEGLDRIAGPMIATVPVRIKLDGQQRVDSFLQSVQDQSFEMVPFEQFGLQNIAKVNDAARQACEFSSLFAIQPGKFTGDSEDNKNAILVLDESNKYSAADIEKGFYTYPLVVQLHIHAEGIEFDIVYSSDLLSNHRIEALTHHLIHVAEQLMHPGDSLLRDVSVAGPWDLDQFLTWNGREDLTPVNRCVHHFFAQHVADCPEKEAIYSTDRSMSYAELDQLSSRLAVHLQSIGVQVETVVPFCFEKSIWTVVSVVAILKAGGAFMPMDPSHPFEYRQGLVKQVNADVVMVSPTTATRCEGMAKHVVAVGASSSFLQPSPLETEAFGRLPQPGPKNAAYVLFSSGSTGTPKGIVVEHAAFSASLTGHTKRFGFTKESRVLQFSNYVFDVSVSEIITTLATGATICVPNDTERLQSTTQFITESKSNLATMTPSFIRTLHPSQVPTLQTLMAGGEAVTSDVVETWAECRTFINAYGPAEASVYSVTYEYKTADEVPATIGRGVNNAVWVVDTDNPDRLAPVGCIGELVLQGPAIARGYVNNPERTAQSFSTSVDFLPEEAIQRAPRFYRTGDLVQYQQPGELVYMGRSDAQVKLRGQRIELGDIEYKIKRTDNAIEQVVVEIVSHRSSEALVAFVLFTGDAAIKNSKKLVLDASTDMTRSYFKDMSTKLTKVLPAHMIPTYYVPVASLSQTSSGKIDRKTVRERGQSLSTEELLSYAVSTRRAFRDCVDDTQRRLRKVWGETLGVEESSISVEDNFYDLGGDSIRIVTLIKYIQKEFGVLLGLAMLNSRSTTILHMAELLEASFNETSLDGVDLNAEISSLSESRWVGTINNPGFKPVTFLPSQSTVFLTGATGFLGTQILRQLLSLSSVKRVITLVRAVSAPQGLERVKKTALVAGWWTKESAEKIEVWTGDLGSSRLGLNDSEWEQLEGKSVRGTVDAIIHNGAVVNWNAEYETLRAPNVESMVELLRVSIESRATPKMVFVSGGAQTDINADRTQMAREMAGDIGYSQTKFVAESVLNNVAYQLPAAQTRISTVKPGMIMGTAEEGVANVDDFIWRIVATAVQMKLYPTESEDSWISISDAGSVANTVISQLFSEQISPFLELSTGLRASVFWELVNSELSHPCAPMSWDVWVARALEHMDDVGETHPLWPVQHFLGDSLGQPDVPELPTPEGSTEVLRAAIKKNMQYLLRIGFLQSNAGETSKVHVDVIGRSTATKRV